MRELIVKLGVVDGEAAGALRVIDMFDRLVEERATAAAVVRAAAQLAGAAAGLHDAGRGITCRFDTEGRQIPGAASAAGPRADVRGQPGSFVWLERSAQRGPLDALILERAARAVQALTRSPAHRSADEALRIACDPSASAEERRDAAARLGLSGPVTVVVSDAPTLPAPHVTRLGPHCVAVLRGPVDLPGDVRLGAAAAEDAEGLPRALEQARTALSLADRVGGAGPPQVDYADLGALAAVAEQVPPHAAKDVGDVRRLDAALSKRPWAIDTLQAVLDRPSLRQAAASLHIHHSTLQERLAWLASQLGFGLARPGGRQRASAAVLLWRIGQSGAGAAGAS